MNGLLLRPTLVTVSAAVLLCTGCLVDLHDQEELEEISSIHQHIVNGQLNTGDPAVGMLSIGNFVCTGTMITQRVMLTARHCVVDQNTGIARPIDGIRVSFRSNPGSGGSINALAYQYNPNADLAAVALDQIAAVQPIPFNTRDLEPHVGKTVRVVGYGLTSETGVDSGIKREGVTKLHRLDSVRNYGEIMYIGNEGSKTCYGDSGGPAFMVFDDVEYLVGVTSFGTGTCEAPTTLDGQVRVDKYRNWISAFINQHDPDGVLGDGTTPVPFSASGNLNGGCSASTGSTAGGFALAFLVLLVGPLARSRARQRV